jgi:hypothetical protein
MPKAPDEYPGFLLRSLDTLSVLSRFIRKRVTGMPMIRIYLRFAVIGAALILTPVISAAHAGDIAGAAPCTGTAKSEDLFKVFADSPQLQPSQYEVSDLEKIYPAFQHQPYEQAGFNPIVLPFGYQDTDHLGDANEALAFDALLSYDLDWCPGNYCTRHALYISQHDPRAGFLRSDYPPKLVTALIKFWRGTHAIGGSLIKTAAGYKGKLLIFSPGGSVAVNHSFDTPRDYWQLLGDMDAEAMQFFGSKPSPELVEFLRQPRCGKMQSLVDLGSTAFMSEGPPGALDVYEKILKADPSFSMVRTWAANQKFLTDHDTRAQSLELGTALSSRLEPAALVSFSPAECPDREMVSQYGFYLNDAAKLTSEDNPLILDCRINKRYYGNFNRVDVQNRALRVAAKYPNSHYLVRSLAQNLQDPWMSASLIVSAMQDRFLPGFSDKDVLQYDLAYEAMETVRDDVAMQMLSALGEKQQQGSLYRLLNALALGGRFSEAVQCYGILGPKFDPSQAKWMAPYAAFSAAVTGDADLLDKVLSDQHEVLALQRLDDVFAQYRDALQGKDPPPQPFDPHQPINFTMLWRVLLAAYTDAKAGKSDHHDLMMRCTEDWPLWRLGWIAQDDYQRRDPSRDASAIYEYLDWMFPSDPWVTKAVADFHDRGGIYKPIDAFHLKADLTKGIADGPDHADANPTQWARVPTPWRVATCVHQLLQQNNRPKAMEIAKLYLNYESMGTYNIGRHNVALQINHLVRLWK